MKSWSLAGWFSAVVASSTGPLPLMPSLITCSRSLTPSPSRYCIPSFHYFEFDVDSVSKLVLLHIIINLSLAFISKKTGYIKAMFNLFVAIKIQRALKNPVEITSVAKAKANVHCAIFRCARLCPCQPITSLWAAAWPRCTSAQMEPTCTGSGPLPVWMRRHRKATLSSWMSFTLLWVLYTVLYTVSAFIQFV